MDRRQKKTRDAVFSALSTLLTRKKYNDITVQNLIDEANIGRSTFYSHFETKDEMLHQMCKSIFEHVFSDNFQCEYSQNFKGRKGLENRITHILYHIRDNKRDLTAIAHCESAEVFWDYFRSYVPKLFDESIKTHADDEIPDEFVVCHVIGSFVDAVKWWISHGMIQKPETIAHWFCAIETWL